MAINRLPSAWDYAAEGISGFNQGREQKRKRQMEEFNLINQLYQSGAATSEQLTAAARASGIPTLANFSALPSATERKDRAVVESSQPYTNVPQVSGLPLPATPDLTKLRPDADLKAEVAGVSTPTQRQGARQSVEMGKTQLGVAQTSAAAQGQDIKNRQNKEADDLFRDAGKRFVSKYIDPATVNAASRQSIVDRAFSEYKTVRQTSAMGQVPDEAYARSFFDEAFTEALREKHKLDLETKYRTEGKVSDEDRLYARLEQTRTHVKDQMDDLANRDKMLVQFKIGDPKYETDPNVIRYNRLSDQIKRIEMAQSKLLPANLRSVMEEPTAGGSPSPTATPAPVTGPPSATSFGNKVDRMVAKVTDFSEKGLKTAFSQIDAAIGKTMTMDEANAVKKKLQEKATKQKRMLERNMDTVRRPPA